jgi:cyclopropane fatty-acyl-phospholipid synthase-like methyltransferase
MNDPKQEFLKSLDLPHEDMAPFIPFILEDLWELGSMPMHIATLIRKHIPPGAFQTITDFGCGKGAVLIHLASEFPFDGLGIDIVPEFIDSARKYAQSRKVAERLIFSTKDILEAIPEINNRDIVIYGHDSAILGNVKESLLQLKTCLSEKGWIILEATCTPDGKSKIEGLPSEKELHQQIADSGLKKIDSIMWDRQELIAVNNRNNELIYLKIEILKNRHPEKTRLFEQYWQDQLKECRLLANDLICSTWLLKN